MNVAEEGAETTAAEHASLKPDEKAGRPRLWLAGWQWGILALLMAALIAWPLIRLEARVFTGGSGPLHRLTKYPHVVQVYLNTIGIALGAVAIALVAGTALAWCTAHAPTRIQRFISVLPIVPLLMPSVATVEGWSYLLSPRTGIINKFLRDNIGIDGSATSGPFNVFSMLGIILLTGAILTSFVFLFVSASLRQRGGELEAAASACGASPIRTFFTVTLPLLRPALIYSAAISFLLALGQLTVPLLLGASDHIYVVGVAVYNVSGDYPVDYALGGALALPLLVAGIAIVLVQRRALRDERRYVALSARARQVGVKTSWWYLLPVVGYLLIVVVLPVLALIDVSLAPYWSGQIQPSKFTLDNWQTIWNDPNTRTAISTTLYALLFTLLIVLPLSYLAAVALLQRTRVPRFVRWSIDILSSISLCMPAALVGFAFLLTYSSAPFKLYGTTAMVVVAYVTLTLPFAIRPQLSALVAVGPEYAEASRTAGAGSLRTAWKINLPLIRSGLGVAAALATIVIVHEFTVSLMVTSPQRRVIGSVLYDQAATGTASGVAVLALMMLVVTLIGMVISLIIGGGRMTERT